MRNAGLVPPRCKETGKLIWSSNFFSFDEKVIHDLENESYLTGESAGEEEKARVAESLHRVMCQERKHGAEDEPLRGGERRKRQEMSHLHVQARSKSHGGARAKGAASSTEETLECVALELGTLTGGGAPAEKRRAARAPALPRSPVPKEKLNTKGQAASYPSRTPCRGAAVAADPACEMICHFCEQEFPSTMARSGHQRHCRKRKLALHSHKQEQRKPSAKKPRIMPSPALSRVPTLANLDPERAAARTLLSLASLRTPPSPSKDIRFATAAPRKKELDRFDTVL